MLSVSSMFILVDKDNGFGLPVETSVWLAGAVTVAFTMLYLWYDNRD